MAVQHSMTGSGFASHPEGISISIKGLNARHAEIALKVPPQLEGLEATLRRRLASAIVRGKIDCAVRIEPLNLGARSVVTDRRLFRELNNAFIELVPDATQAERREFSISHAAKVAIRLSEENSRIPNLERITEQLMAVAIKQFQEARAREGRVLVKDMLKRLKTIGVGAKKISVQAKVLAKRFLKNIVLAEGSGDTVWKGDVTEEIVRLYSHINEAEHTLRGSECGKRLEFILQEILREANTVASKAQDSAIQLAVVGIKVELEKIREQALNLE